MKENWTYKKLGEVCEIICGQDYKSIQDDNGMFPIYGTGGVMGRASQYRCPAYSIIIGRKGNINNPLFVEEPFWNVDTAFGVVPNASVLFPKFFYFFCKKYDFTKHDVSVTIPSLRRADIINIAVPIPPLSEQSRIVSELDLLQSIIDKQKAQLKELDNLAQAVFYDMFGDPVENDKGWERKPLKEIGKVITGNTPSTKDEENYSSNDYCFVKPSDIDKDAVSYITETEFYISSKAFEKSRQLPEGSVLTTCIGIIGKVGILKKKATCNQQINAIIPSDDISSTYLAYSIVGTKRVLELLANAPVVPIINKGDFSNVIIPVPPLHLQQSFAAKIESIEKQKAAINQSIAETQRLFDYTMDKYFG
jgi:type I restriction enzyme S subunit